MQTPEWTTIQWPIAGIGSRALAALVDSLLIFVVDSLLVAAAVFTGSHVGMKVLAQGGAKLPFLYAIALLMLIAFLFTLFYFVLCESLWSGQSVGKKIFHLRVMSTQGRRITFFSSFVRNLVRIVDFLPTGYLIGIIFMIVTKKEQRLGDIAAGTVVISERNGGIPMHITGAFKRRKGKQFGAHWLEPVGELPMEAAMMARQCTEEERSLVEEFIRRAPLLGSNRADDLAEHIAERLCGVLSDYPASVEIWARSKTPPELLRSLYQVWVNKLP